MSRASRFLLWLVATGVTTALAYYAVGAVGSEVSDRPLTGVVAAPSPSTSTTTGASGSASSLPPAVGPTTTPTGPTTTLPGSSATPWQQATLNSAGGSIIVSHRPEEVRLESVIPRAGFAYEIKDQGPDRVEVEFESGEARYRLRAEWTDSGFVTDVEADED